MASPVMGLEAATCPEKKALSEAYLAAVRDMTELLEKQSQALIDGGEKFERFELALTVARRRQENAKLALALHVQAHGC